MLLHSYLIVISVALAEYGVHRERNLYTILGVIRLTERSKWYTTLPATVAAVKARQ